MALGALLLFIVGTSVQAGWLLALSSCLLGVTVAGALLPRRMVRRVEIERRASAEAFQGDEVAIDLVISNPSRGMRLGLDVLDAHVQPARVFVGHLGPGERVAVSTLRAANRRGVHRSAEIVLSSSAPFGVAERRRVLEVAGETVVYPTLEALDGLPFVDASPTHDRALHAFPRRGGGPEYLGIREYRSGDSMRHVHWPSTARHGELMVRELEREQTRRLAIVLDTSADVGEELTPLDRACSVAASVAFAAVAQGQGVRMVAAVDGEPQVLSRAEPAQLLRWLAELRPFGGLTFPAMLDALGPELLGAETVVVVLPTWRGSATTELVEPIGELCVRVPRVVAVLVEAHTFDVERADRRRSPVLTVSEVDELDRARSARGVWVDRVPSGKDLAECLRRTPVSV